MRWHQRAEMHEGEFLLWINYPEGDYEQYRADRIATFQLLVFWAFAEIICAFDAAPKVDLQTLSTIADSARTQLESAPIFFSGEKWDIQLILFIFPKND